jgi:ADP-heptose:LPS heptosyltransferase
MPIVLLGGPDEVETANYIERHLGGQVLNMVGQVSLNGSASLIRQAESVITHDSGMMHIAAAFNKNIVSIWGNTIPDFGMYPYMPDHPERVHIIQVNELSCRPCSKIGYDKCPKGHFKCMEQIDVKAVVRAVACGSN